MKDKLRLAIINSTIAGLLVFFGSFTNGIITWQGLLAAFSASVIIFLTKIKDYCNKKGVKGMIFEFI